MDINPYFTDFDPTAAANSDLNAAEQWKIMQDAETASTAMILDSTEYRMEVNDEAFQNFDDVITGNDTSVDPTATGDAMTGLHTTNDATDIGANALEGAAPQHMDTLPDGREVLITGDTDGYRDFNHQQGDNDLGFQQDCGLVSSQDVLNQFGVDVNENDVVHHAVDNNECQVVPGDNANSGGTTADWQANVLSDYGVPAHVENGGSMDDLANNIQDGHGVIIEVNAGVLWDDPNSYGDGQSNHAITVTGVVRDPSTSEITGFVVNDSGDGKGEKYVDAATMQQMWVDTGGQSVVTDVTH
ncbi:MAG TPA: C39 family peptidase [Chthonomonadaceae bacterium]|nr:C39 family peptidase [Chthonomonadaceae bacterium]